MVKQYQDHRTKRGPRPKPKLFKIPEETTRPLPQGLHRVPPKVQGVAAVMASEEKRDRASAVLQAYSCMLMQPVRSNEELQDRGLAYFHFCSQRRLFPTVEGLAVYLGSDWRTVHTWETGEQRPFHDGNIPTADIVRHLKAIIEATDGDLASSGDVNTTAWIFRRKAVSGWQDTQKIEIASYVPEETPHLTPEEIAARLPDLDDEI